MSQKILDPIISFIKLDEKRITESLHYNLEYIKRNKTINSYHWHPEEKCLKPSYNNGILERIPEILKGKNIYLDPNLKFRILMKKSQNNFEDLRRELFSRNYSYKNINSCIFYNSGLLELIGKEPSKINENDIKNFSLA